MSEDVQPPKEIEVRNDAAIMQAEYDRHVASYRRGCRGCSAYARAVVEMAKKLGVEIKEVKL